jgi:hypothetical protein
MTSLYNIDYPILTDFIIDNNPPKNLALSDPVLCFSDSNDWIIVDIKELLKTPIIWTKFYDDKKAKDVSIVICPRTLRGSIFDGKLKSKYYDNNDRLILETDEKTIISIDANISVDSNLDILSNKRYQIFIQTFRNSLVDFYDVKYLHPNGKNNKFIINKKYLENRLDEYDQEIIQELNYHPKTLVHIIQYLSHKGERKITLIIGSDSSKIDSLGYDNKKSGFDKYLLTYENEIIKKDCFIMPILYYKAIKIYKDAKIIIL